MCRPRRGGLLSAWTCTPAQRLPGDSEGEEPNKRERESAEKERGRGRGHTFGCGKMPSAHSLTQPRPAFRRLRTCKSVLRLHRSHTVLTGTATRFAFPLLARLLRALLSTIAVTQQQFTSLHFLLLLACVSRLQVAPLLFHNSAVPLGLSGSNLWVFLRKETAANIQTGDTPIGNRTQHIQSQVLSEGP